MRRSARRCSKNMRAEIDGLIIYAAELWRGAWAGGCDPTGRPARVPVLIQATPDALGQRVDCVPRDSFCGKMSICNNLKQYGIPYSLTTAAYRGAGLG